jgi:hypothetical protein
MRDTERMETLMIRRILLTIATLAVSITGRLPTLRLPQRVDIVGSHESDSIYGNTSMHVAVARSRFRGVRC